MNVEVSGVAPPTGPRSLSQHTLSLQEHASWSFPPFTFAALPWMCLMCQLSWVNFWHLFSIPSKVSIFKYVFLFPYFEASQLSYLPAWMISSHLSRFILKIIFSIQHSLITLVSLDYHTATYDQKSPLNM